MSVQRLPCPDCGIYRWLRISTNGNGGTTDEWQPCTSPDCPSNKETPMAGSNHRLTPEERAKVMEVLRDPAHSDCNDREISDLLARDHGVTISPSSIGITYRPRLHPLNGNGNGHTNGNGKPAAVKVVEKPARAAVVKPEPEPVVIDALPYQIYQLEDGSVQVHVDIVTTAPRALAIISAVNAALLP